MAQFRFTLWLAYWYLHEKHFIFEWDRGNSIKNKVKHGIDKREIESVFTLRQAMPIGIQVSPSVEELRFCIVGPSERDRLISVVFTMRNEKVRPISSRTANKKEKQLYEKIRQAIEGL